MKIIEFLLALFSVLCLVANQVLLKHWLEKRNIAVWPLNSSLFKSMLSVEMIIIALLVILSGFIWIYLLSKVEFSILYPMISLSYVFGALAAKYIFNENIPTTRWFGIVFIIIGVLIITKK